MVFTVMQFSNINKNVFYRNIETGKLKAEIMAIN